MAYCPAAGNTCSIKTPGLYAPAFQFAMKKNQSDLLITAAAAALESATAAATGAPAVAAGASQSEDGPH